MRKILLIFFLLFSTDSYSQFHFTSNYSLTGVQGTCENIVSPTTLFGFYLHQLNAFSDVLFLDPKTFSVGDISMRSGDPDFFPMCLTVDPIDSTSQQQVCYYSDLFTPHITRRSITVGEFLSEARTMNGHELNNAIIQATYFFNEFGITLNPRPSHRFTLHPDNENFGFLEYDLNNISYSRCAGFPDNPYNCDGLYECNPELVPDPVIPPVEHYSCDLTHVDHDIWTCFYYRLRQVPIVKAYESLDFFESVTSCNPPSVSILNRTFYFTVFCDFMDFITQPLLILCSSLWLFFGVKIILSA